MDRYKEATNRIDKKDDFNKLKKSLQKHNKKSLQLSEKNKIKIMADNDKSREMVDGIYKKPALTVSFNENPDFNEQRGRRKSIPGEISIDDRHLRKIYSSIHRPVNPQKAGYIYNIHDNKHSPVQSDMSTSAAKEAFKKFSERKIRRPSWLPKPK